MLVKTLSWENEKSPFSFVRNFSIVILASIAIGLLGQISISLPFTPVPIVTQVQAVLLLGFLLGKRRAAAAVFAFLLQGAIGLPVFANGSAGIAKLIGPTGGYLIGYMVAAYAVGAIAERIKERSVIKAFGALLAGNGIVYLLGTAYLASFLNFDFQKAILAGIVPFVIGDLIKNVACLKILQWTGWERK